jgi:thiol-disulfide isomerase/thioredoxin/protocatechuate 3,4-dioxygenase beta subunit
MFIKSPSLALITMPAIACLALVPLLASGQTAEPALSDPTEVAANQELNAERTMRVQVLDMDGKPIARASLFVNASEVERSGKFPSKTYRTDSQGEVDVRLPNRLRILRIWASKPGYVPQFLNFAEGTHQEGKSLPGSYRFYLETGERIGGTVVDQDDQPVARAKVQVRVDVSEPDWDSERPWGSSPDPIISTWLAYGSEAIMTDSLGRWQISNAPANRGSKDYEFRLQVSHPDFSGDTRWGELQEQQGVTTAQLREGTAKIKLDPGLKIHGKVTGPDGAPITAGLVSWHDQPYFTEGVHEIAIDDSGHYRTLPLRPGQYPVTVLAPGYAPQQVKFVLAATTTELNFQLDAGKQIELKIVDHSGHPIPDAYVGIGPWRGSHAIYNERHSNVPNSKIPIRADSAGIYRWDWAPEDSVVYRIGTSDYATAEVALVARDEPHRIELAPLMKVYGSVTDQETGRPIEKFSVVPVKAFGPDFYSTDFQNPLKAEHGKYELRINGDGQTGIRYRVRVAAAGYRTALSTRSVAVGDPPLCENFQLQPAAALAVEVVDPDGNPAMDFMVAIGTPTTAPSFSIERPDFDFGIAFRVSGSNRFELPATCEPQLIRVFNDFGFAEIDHAVDASLDKIELQRWAVLNGRLMQGDQPIANEGVYFRPLVRRGLTQARFQDSFFAKTDREGNFQFDRLPPMPGHVQAQLGPWDSSPLSSSQSIAVDLIAGETKTVLLGSGGHRVVGKVVANGRDNAALSKQWSLNHLISRTPGMRLPASEKPLTIDPEQGVDGAVIKASDFSTWLGTKLHYFVKLSDDGRLLIDGVPTGEYDLVIQLYEQPTGCLVETIGQEIIPVSVDDSAQQTDLGEIAVECRSGPRVGSDMRAFKFIDASARRQSVADMNGRFVLFHVWASWCAPCLQSLPIIKAFIDGNPDAPLTIVGLNVDEQADREQSQQLISAGEWDWAMNFLGSESDMMRQLGVSSVPAYYLIGPDGKLQMSANQWSEIESQLRAALAR